MGHFIDTRPRAPKPLDEDKAWAHRVKVMWETEKVIDGRVYVQEHIANPKQAEKAGVITMSRGKITGKKASVIIEIPANRPWHTVFAKRPTEWTHTGPGVDDGFSTDRPWPTHRRA